MLKKRRFPDEDSDRASMPSIIDLAQNTKLSQRTHPIATPLDVYCVYYDLLKQGYQSQDQISLNELGAMNITRVSMSF